mgnify:CR=1 FL=1
MATYPQGVTDFIPDYQPYQPDLNLTANVLQLKQTQYDKNWESLNKVYGQIYNAQLTHDQSIKNKDKMVKQIDFDLRRVSGLDLSLDQNVQQATQVFRPFYEDASLMKDMAWTKNTGFQRSMGEGKQLAAKKEDRDQYWGGGIRAIDYKVQEFKETPYEQLPGVADVKWTPYVNVQTAARKLADESGLSIDFTQESPDHRWLVRQKNGEPLIGPLQDLFYSELGSDPMIQGVFQTKAYLNRKDTIQGTKDNPEFGGDPVSAEKKYLSESLTMLKEQNELQVKSLENEKASYQKNLKTLQGMVDDGTATPDTQKAIDQLTVALGQTDKRLNGAKEDLNLVSDNLNKTLTTSGGSKLSMDDLNDMRFRVDNAMASGLMQAEFDKAAHNLAYRDYVYDPKPNPFQVNLENHGHRMSEIGARAQAQWNLELLKHGLKQEELIFEAKKDSGKYILKEDEKGNVSWAPNPLLNTVLPEKGTGSDATTGPTDTKKVQEHITKVLGIEPAAAKNLAVDLLRELNAEGTLSDESVLRIVGNQGLSPSWESKVTKFLENYVVDPDNDWTVNSRTKNDAGLRRKTKTDILKQGIYKTDLEKEDEIAVKKQEEQTPPGQRVKQKLNKLANTKIENVDPEDINGFVQRLFAELSLPQYRDQKAIKDSKRVAALVDQSFQLMDYADYLTSLKAAKQEIAVKTINRLKAEGFAYADALFDENWDKRSKQEWQAAIANNRPDDIINGSGMTWSSYLTAATSAAGAGGTYGSFAGPVGTTAGAIGGFLAGTVGYLGSKGINYLYNVFTGDEGDDVGLAYAQTSAFGQNTLSEEFNAMDDVIKEASEGNKTDWQLPIVGLPNGGRDGSGLYTANGAAITIRPGVTNTDVFPMYMELQKILGNVDIGDYENANGSYVTTTGVNTKRDDLDTDDKATNALIWRTLNNMYNSEVMNGKSNAGDIKYIVSPIAGGEFGQAAVTIKPQNAEFLKKLVQTDSNPSGLITSDMYNEILQNGITLITNANNLVGSTLYKNSYMSRMQARIENAGPNGVTYRDPLDPDYSMTLQKNTLGTGDYVVTTQIKYWDVNDQKDSLIQNVISLGNMGKNLESHRSKFFNETVPKYKAIRQQQYGSR